ncbi:MAG: ABC transporter ATP-binding protein [Rikenellaceae bacterium]
MKISLQNISLGYKNRTLLESVSTEFDSGSMTALLGRNGTGKSTLLRAITGLGKLDSGEILIDDTNIKNLSTEQIARSISFVNTEKVRIANLTCYQLVSLGRVPYTNWIGTLTPEDKTIIEKSLELVGMSDYTHKPINKISDGELQRVMIARALAQDTPIILLDEPTAFLDLPNKYEVCAILKNLAKNQSKTIIFSTHDLDIALKICDKVAIIDTPKIIHDTPEGIKKTGEIDRLFKIKDFNF